MTLLNVERIKLFSTRSPYWCLAAIAAASLGFATLFGLVEDGDAALPYIFLRGVGLGMSIYMVLAALAVTTEYRFGTIRNTFLGVPRRPAVLLAKTVLLALIGAVVGLVAAVGSYFLARSLAQNPPVPLVLSSWDDWRQIVGYGAIFGIAAIIAVSVGTIVRQSAGAIAILLLWPLIIESLFTLIPTVGPKVGSLAAVHGVGQDRRADHGRGQPVPARQRAGRAAGSAGVRRHRRRAVVDRPVAAAEAGCMSEACRANIQHSLAWRPVRGDRACEVPRKGVSMSEACRANISTLLPGVRSGATEPARCPGRASA